MTESICYVTPTCIMSFNIMLHRTESIIAMHFLVRAIIIIIIIIIIYIAVNSTVLQQGKVQSINDDAGQ